MPPDRLTRGDLWLFAAVLAAFGVADAAVLTWQRYAAPSATWCDIGTFFSCTRVRESPFASVAGIPVAVIGLLGFVALLAVAVFGLQGRHRIGPVRTEHVLLGLAAAGTVVGAVLTVIEVFVIESICILCAIGFALDVGILGIAWQLRPVARDATR